MNVSWYLTTYLSIVNIQTVNMQKYIKQVVGTSLHSVQNSTQQISHQTNANKLTNLRN